MNYLCAGGEILPADQPVFRADNRGYRYGDGLFETMKVIRKKICLEQYHWQRLFAGLQLLQFDIPLSFTAYTLREQIFHLCELNRCTELGRIRLSVFRGNGGLADDNLPLEYMIECRPVDDGVNRLNTDGFVAGIYTGGYKSCDLFSGLKSASYLTYVMAAKYARQHRLDDCLVLNNHGRIADAGIANVFLVKGGRLFTPAAGEGGIDGVMRRYLLEKCRDTIYAVEEKAVTLQEVQAADELFFTNAVYGMRWVKQLGEKQYGGGLAVKIYKEFIKPIWD